MELSQDDRATAEVIITLMSTINMMETEEDIAHAVSVIKESIYFSDREEIGVFVSLILNFIEKRPLKVAVFATFIRRLIEIDNESAKLFKRTLIQYFATPLTCKLACIRLFRELVDHDVFSASDIVSRIILFANTYLTDIISLCYLTAWFLPEIEQIDFKFGQYVKQTALSSTEVTSSDFIREFFENIDAYKESQYSLWSYCVKRNCLPQSITEILRRDDVSELSTFLEENSDYSINSTIPRSIFDISLYVNHGVTLVQYAAFIGAENCLKYLVESDANVNITKVFYTDRDFPSSLGDFAVAGGFISSIHFLYNKIDFENTLHTAAFFFQNTVYSWLSEVFYNRVTENEKEQIFYSAAQAHNVSIVISVGEKMKNIPYQIKFSKGKMSIISKDSNKLPIKEAKVKYKQMHSVLPKEHKEVLKLYESIARMDDIQECQRIQNILHKEKENLDRHFISNMINILLPARFGRRHNQLMHLLPCIIDKIEHDPEVNNKPILEQRALKALVSRPIVSTTGEARNDIQTILLYDTIKALKKLSRESTFDYNGYIDEQMTYIQYAALVGSLECFKFLWAHPQCNRDNLAKYIVAGGNRQIFLMAYSNDINFDYCLSTAIRYHNNHLIDYLMYFEQNYRKILTFALECNNIQAYAFLKKNELSYDDNSIMCVAHQTGNKKLVESLESTRGTVQLNTLQNVVTSNTINEEEVSVPDFAFGYESDHFSETINIETESGNEEANSNPEEINTNGEERTEEDNEEDEFEVVPRRRPRRDYMEDRGGLSLTMLSTLKPPERKESFLKKLSREKLQILMDFIKKSEALGPDRFTFTAIGDYLGVSHQVISDYNTRLSNNAEYNPRDDYDLIGRCMSDALENRIKKRLDEEFADKERFVNNFVFRDICRDEWDKADKKDKFTEEFKASDEFCLAFRKRHGYVYRRPTLARRPEDSMKLRRIKEVYNRVMARRYRQLKNENKLYLLVNADETSWQCAYCGATTWARKGAKEVKVSTNWDPKARVTAMAAINADEEALPLYILAKGKTERCERKFDNIEGYEYYIDHSPNGWSTKEIMCNYLQLLRDIYDEKYKDRNGYTVKETPIYLMWDCYSAHRNEDVKRFAKDLNIIIYFIPAGCTSILQPLDMKVFGPLKAAARGEWYKIYSIAPNTKIDVRFGIETLLKCWADFRHEDKKKPLKSAWKYYETIAAQIDPSGLRSVAPTEDFDYDLIESQVRAEVEAEELARNPNIQPNIDEETDAIGTWLQSEDLGEKNDVEDELELREREFNNENIVISQIADMAAQEKATEKADEEFPNQCYNYEDDTVYPIDNTDFGMTLRANIEEFDTEILEEYYSELKNDRTYESIGIMNIENSCAYNATMQFIHSMPFYNEYLIEEVQPCFDNGIGMASLNKALLEHMSNSKRTINMNDFIYKHFSPQSKKYLSEIEERKATNFLEKTSEIISTPYGNPIVWLCSFTEKSKFIKENGPMYLEVDITKPFHTMFEAIEGQNLPDILPVYIVRGIYDNKPFEFPSHFALGNEENCVLYVLKSWIEAEPNHFTTFVRDGLQGNFYCINDDMISEREMNPRQTVMGLYIKLCHK